MPTTQRLLTDETGQALVTAVNNIVAAVKPNATEIQMSSSDTTTVATAITNINNKIGTVPSGQTVEEQITTLNSNLVYLDGSTNAITDANNIQKTGIYKTVNSTAHTPSAGHYTIYHIEYTNEEKTQLAIATSNGKLYTRVYYNDAWSTWSEK